MLFRCALPLVFALSVHAFRAVAAAPPVDFNRDIRPILNDHCLKCHGGVKEAGDLNLQFREQALRAGETGEIAVVPGKPEESAFIDRITTDDKTDRMPKKADPLTTKQIETMRRWIAEGAPWGKHWSYEAPKGWGKSIDEIVQARLAKERLALSPEADVRILARRMAFDLTGLPPELIRVDALEKAAATDREGALRGYVDELLASPAYGDLSSRKASAATAARCSGPAVHRQTRSASPASSRSSFGV